MRGLNIVSIKLHVDDTHCVEYQEFGTYLSIVYFKPGSLQEQSLSYYCKLNPFWFQ